MPRISTAGTKMFSVEIDAGLRERVAERVKAEQRTLRVVVERALTYYLEHVPVNGSPPAPAKAKPKNKGK